MSRCHANVPIRRLAALALLAALAVAAAGCASTAPRSPGEPAASSALPAFGDSIAYDEPPEVLDSVAPEWHVIVERPVRTTVVVWALVDTDGYVRDARAAQADPFGSDAVAAVRKWMFRPAKANGRPVAVWTPVRLEVSIR